MSRGTEYAFATAAPRWSTRDRGGPRSTTRGGSRPFSRTNASRTARAPPRGTGAGSQNVSSSGSSGSSASAAELFSGPASASASSAFCRSASAAAAARAAMRSKNGCGTGSPIDPKCASSNENAPNASPKRSGFVSAAPGKCDANARAEAANVASACEPGSTKNARGRDDSGAKKSPRSVPVPTVIPDALFPVAKAAFLFASRALSSSACILASVFASASASSSNRNSRDSHPPRPSSSVRKPRTKREWCASATRTPTSNTAALDAGNRRRFVSNARAICDAISICVISPASVASHTPSTRGRSGGAAAERSSRSASSPLSPAPSPSSRASALEKTAGVVCVALSLGMTTPSRALAATRTTPSASLRAWQSRRTLSPEPNTGTLLPSHAARITDRNPSANSPSPYSTPWRITNTSSEPGRCRRSATRSASAQTPAAPGGDRASSAFFPSRERDDDDDADDADALAERPTTVRGGETTMSARFVPSARAADVRASASERISPASPGRVATARWHARTHARLARSCSGLCSSVAATKVSVANASSSPPARAPCTAQPASRSAVPSTRLSRVSARGNHARTPEKSTTRAVTARSASDSAASPDVEGGRPPASSATPEEEGGRSPAPIAMPGKPSRAELRDDASARPANQIGRKRAPTSFLWQVRAPETRRVDFELRSIVPRHARDVKKPRPFR